MIRTILTLAVCAGLAACSSGGASGTGSSGATGGQTTTGSSGSSGTTGTSGTGGVGACDAGPGSWSPVDAGLGNDAFRAVGGSGPNDVFVVTGSPPGLILHWDGTAWAEVDQATGGLNAVWSSGPGSAWAVGGGTLEHWDGGSWGATAWREDGGQSPSFTGVWGSGDDDAWAVGATMVSTGTGYVLAGTHVVHWDGASWTEVPFSAPPAVAPKVVTGSGPADVWVLGRETAGSGANESVLFHWDGGTWSQAQVFPNVPLTALADDAAGHAWAVGDGVSYFWNGSSWLPTSPSLPQDFVSWAVWIDGETVWVSGADAANGLSPAIAVWRGCDWSVEDFPALGAGSPFEGIWGSGPTDLWAVAPYGGIWRGP